MFAIKTDSETIINIILQHTTIHFVYYQKNHKVITLMIEFFNFSAKIDNEAFIYIIGIADKFSNVCKPNKKAR